MPIPSELTRNAAVECRKTKDIDAFTTPPAGWENAKLPDAHVMDVCDVAYVMNKYERADTPEKKLAVIEEMESQIKGDKVVRAAYRFTKKAATYFFNWGKQMMPDPVGKGIDPASEEFKGLESLAIGLSKFMATNLENESEKYTIGCEYGSRSEYRENSFETCHTASVKCYSRDPKNTSTFPGKYFNSFEGYNCRSKLGNL